MERRSKKECPHLKKKKLTASAKSVFWKGIGKKSIRSEGIGTHPGKKRAAAPAAAKSFDLKNLYSVKIA